MTGGEGQHCIRRLCHKPTSDKPTSQCKLYICMSAVVCTGGFILCHLVQVTSCGRGLRRGEVHVKSVGYVN
ncbi:hypothetical protein HOLleu_34816 [Holothuria leucospilota]|uniref:Uncharacterized protein n=1 Tax=Holothuria leucospilota TaxID=206669 RepID=A0A9Q1BFM5_HOLLE|nr:hypothetical protein HOLleu_34816 [Holothuria leucospilota]